MTLPFAIDDDGQVVPLDSPEGRSLFARHHHRRLLALATDETTISADAAAPDVEPTFTLRASDPSAPGALRSYYAGLHIRGASRELLDEVWAMQEQFREWQRARPDEIQLPAAVQGE